ncbi:MAG: protoheme IX farnesyltransferase [Parachlamydiaceae bacterium]|nr:protoheme IX farnesyltransferase [Parachlamydiaceae bacterium]
MINYLLITKPGIILGNLVTLAAGFLLASKGVVNYLLFFETLLGLAFIMASACVFNNYIDIPIDRKMERTKNRSLVTGIITGRNAIIFASVLGILGTIVLALTTNTLTVFVAAVGFFVYVILYSMWKSHTIYGTAIGSIAGAIPPVVGYCAVSNDFDAGAIILFTMLVLWQMPHFFSIALYRFNDYKAAGLPLLPIKKGMLRTKIHMVLYILAYIAASTLLTIFNYTGYVYLAVALVSGFAWLWLCLKGFSTDNDQVWGKQMFQLSLVLITAVSIAIPLDIVKPIF